MIPVDQTIIERAGPELYAALNAERALRAHRDNCSECLAADRVEDYCGDEYYLRDEADRLSAAALASVSGKEVCEICKKANGTEDHSCPLAAELSNDDTTLCNCCANCTEDCSGSR